jgi:hypothetical protein
MRKAGVDVARLDIMPDGRISIVPSGPVATNDNAESAGEGEWDAI